MFTGFELYVVVLIGVLNTTVWSAVYRVANPIVQVRVLQTPTGVHQLHRVDVVNYKLETVRTSFVIPKHELEDARYDIKSEIRHRIAQGLVTAILPYVECTEYDDLGRDPFGQSIVTEGEIKIGIRR